MKVVQHLLAHLNLDALNFRLLLSGSLHSEPRHGSPPRRCSAGASVRNSLLLAAFTTLAWAANASAAAFTSGSLVVESVGDGSATLTGSSTPVFLLEFLTTGGAVIQTISPPNAATRPTANPFNLTEGGTAQSGGQLTRSVNGLVISIPGYNGINGDATLTSSSGATVSRTIGVVNNLAAADTSRSLNVFSGVGFRGAASVDGTAFWVSGAGSTTGGGTPGIYYVTGVPGSATSLLNVTARVVKILNGQLYYSTSTGVFSLGTGLPTSGTPTATQIITVTGGSTYSFDINPGSTVAYVADDRIISSGGGILKYTFSGGVWTLQYNLGTGSGSTFGARGLVVDWSGANPVLYATTAGSISSSTNNLIAITDTGSGSTATVLESSAANTAFRGVAFSPVAALSVTCPLTVSVQCASAVPAAANSTATFTTQGGTIGGGCPPYTVSASDATNNQTCPNRFTITRTYTVTDACNNSANCNQIITVNDTTGPVFTNCPADTNLGCNPQTIPGCDPNVGATDACSTVTIYCASVDALGGCLNYRTNTYTAVDSCNNTNTCTQVVTWTVDTTAPVFTNCPASINLGCNPATIPGCDPAVGASDDCGVTNISCASVDALGGCLNYRTNTYTAVDSCNNTNTCTQVITWRVDTHAPVFTNCPASTNLGCNPASIPGCDPAVGASDDCGVTNITCASVDATNGCVHFRTNIYTAVDGCNNSTNCTQVISWTEDTTLPLITCPGDTNTACGQTGTNFTGSATATDGCGGGVVVSFSDVSLPGTCPTNRVITRTWKATDACSNAATCDQTIWVLDTTGPVFTNCPANANLGCNPANIPDCNSPIGVSADCAVTVSCTSVDVTNGCAHTRTNTWTAMDACNHTTTCTQVVTWTEDTVPPAFT